MTHSLYLLNSSVGNNIPILIYNNIGTPLEGYRIKVMRLLSGNYVLVEIGETNFEGEKEIAVVENEPFYKFIIEKDDTIYKYTNEMEIYVELIDFLLNNLSINLSGHIRSGRI